MSRAARPRARSKAKSVSRPGTKAKKPAVKNGESYAGIGDAAVFAKTGKEWHDWFAILDRAKASTWPHREIAAFLYDEHGVPAWWCQMVTVGYEQARGLRVKHQKAGGFAASSSKTIEVPVEKLFAAWSTATARRRWLTETGLTLHKATKPKSMRFTSADGSSVQVNFLVKGPSKSQVAVDHGKLKSAAEVSRVKQVWSGALEKLKTKLEGQRGKDAAFASRTASWILAAAAFLFAAAPASSQITTVPVGTGLQYPVYVTSPPGDEERLFVVEQPGVIKLIKNGVLQETPFLDIQSLVHHEESTELGLLGLAFHPNYASNGYFFVYYTAGPFPLYDVVRRYQVSTNPDSADGTSGQRMIRISDPFGNHNGGQIAFDADGYFYFAPGDGGSAGDPGNRAQDPGELLGKMLRIDLNADDFPSDPFTNYAIPPDNPFVASVDTLPEIWAFGLRNPYRWSFDRETGDLYIGDVGQGEWEEIDFEPVSSPGGNNYGWRLMEGNHCFEPPADCNDGTLVLPVLEYDHPTGFSVIGGYVYRGAAIPSLVGHYFLADYVTDLVWSFRMDNGQAVDLTDWGSVLNPGGEIESVSGFGEDASGELYFVLHGNGANGQVRKMIPDSTSGPGPGPPIHAIQLSRAQPNPFRDTTQFILQLPRSAVANVTLHDSSGRMIRRLANELLTSGAHPFTWNGNDDRGRAVPSGIYFIRADAAGTILSARVAYLR